MASEPQRRRRRQPACVECRLQKVKCNAEPPDACGRCSRMGLECLIAQSPTARKTKAELQRELDAVRRGSALQPVEVRVPSEGAAPHALDAIESDQLPSTPSLSSNNTNANSRFLALDSLLSPEVSVSDAVVQNVLQGSHRCSPQIFEGHEISSTKISDCFSRFFGLYAANSVSMLDATMSPDDYYERCSFLFWTIVYVGSRYYKKDPTILGRLTAKINTMAFLALESRANPIQTIQGILLLALWPVPVHTLHRDVSLVLAGAALHLARQIGLHVAGAGQDFARTRLDRSSSEAHRRAVLWRLCREVHFGVSLREGITPLNFGGPYSVGSSPNQDPELPAQCSFRSELHEIMMGATAALSKEIEYGSDRQNGTLVSLIDYYDSKLSSISTRAVDKLDKVYLYNFRVHILAYSFLVQKEARRLDIFIKLYGVACEALTSACAHDDSANQESEDFPLSISGMVLAALSILKIHRSELSAHLNLEQGEQAYFAAIVSHRERSLHNDDLYSRGATIISQLWNSDKIFKTASGDSDTLGSRIRTRLSMSIVFDCFWWWRQEFGGQKDPYIEQTGHQTRRSSLTPSGAENAGDSHGIGSSVVPADAAESSWDGDNLFLDYNWAMTLNMEDMSEFL